MVCGWTLYCGQIRALHMFLFFVCHHLILSCRFIPQMHKVFMLGEPNLNCARLEQNFWICFWFKRMTPNLPSPNVNIYTNQNTLPFQQNVLHPRKWAPVHPETDWLFMCLGRPFRENTSRSITPIKGEICNRFTSSGGSYKHMRSHTARKGVVFGSHMVIY